MIGYAAAGVLITQKGKIRVSNVLNKRLKLGYQGTAAADERAYRHGARSKFITRLLAEFLFRLPDCSSNPETCLGIVVFDCLNRIRRVLFGWAIVPLTPRRGPGTLG
jgi:hypothetical protein